jgi:seryl-tRNA synthetase
MQREIKILQAANLDLTRQVEEKKKTPPTKWENTQRISDNIQQNEQAYIPNKKELQSIEINKLDLETQIPANQQTYTELDSDQPESIDEMEQLSPELEAGQNKFEKNIQEISILSEQIETPQHESVPSQGQQKDQKVEQEESEPVQMLEQERKVPLLCKQCGKPLADDVRFCRHCGADVN